MEDVLELYHAPFDPNFPLVCMDESSKQLVGEVHPPIPVAPGHGRIEDHEYIRNGVAEIFIEVEPLGGRRHIEITERRTRTDWANFIKGMLDERYPDAIKVRLVMDNLNTHNVASLYQAFPTRRGEEIGREIGNSLHPQAWQLAQRRGDRTERIANPMPQPPDRRSRNVTHGSSGMGSRPKQPQQQNSMALHHR